jgi:hypothetical protein
LGAIFDEGEHDERQLDMFSGAPPAPPPPDLGETRPAGAMSDGELVEAIERGAMSAAMAAMAEAGRRRLAAAVPALAAVCRRFAGFGTERAIPEQAAALAALAEIGGPKAQAAVAAAVARREVQGPGLPLALAAAARLRAALLRDDCVAFLRHPDPAVRAAACRCARQTGSEVEALLGLLSDPDPRTRIAAACALGRMGRQEARGALARLLETAPSAEVVDAASGVADDDMAVLLGRVGRARPELAPAILEALEGGDNMTALKVARSLRAVIGAA